MKLLTAENMRYADNYAINTLNIPSTLLMTNAAEHVARKAMECSSKNSHISIFCGTGNNGGDGIGAAVFLKKHGLCCKVFLIGKREKMTPDSLEMERRLSELGEKTIAFDSSDESIIDYVNSSAVIIDAIFGIGLHSPLRPEAAAAVELINSSNAAVISADIASGVEADTGNILGTAVKADFTVTFSSAKPGHFSMPGGLCCGELIVKDIGIPENVLSEIEADTFAVSDEDVFLPRRKRDAHKGNFGHDLIIAGSVGYTGAPCLASRGAIRAGAGLVQLCVPEKAYGIIALKCTEVMPIPEKCDESGKFSEQSLPSLLKKLEKSDVCLIGPGLGRSEEIKNIVTAIIKKSKIPLIIDADGINALSENINVLDEASCPIILTPHDVEFKRLGGDLLSASRLEAAKAFSKKHNCSLVLKGHRTITAFPDGEAYINTTGNPGMAKGGSGDVLAGIITAFVGQKLPIKKAVTDAVFIHGKTGDICAEMFGEYSMTSSDIIENLYRVIKNVTR